MFFITKAWHVIHNKMMIAVEQFYLKRVNYDEMIMIYNHHNHHDARHDHDANHDHCSQAVS